MKTEESDEKRVSSGDEFLSAYLRQGYYIRVSIKGINATKNHFFLLPSML